MRLHRLRLQAFGPFADAIPTVVDFDALSSEGLFSISGPTGSGKSTLLDAICYALYGETTGGDRQPEDMRSQHAPADMKTFVELDFSLGTGPSRQNYRYRREPKQMVIKARGQGTTEKGGSVSLHRLDAQGREQESLATQIPASKEWTRNLLRLTVEQFRKVVVLPQGKFAEMLRTNSASEREKQLDLFDVLFNTGWASQTMEAIRETRKAGTAAAQKFEVQRQSILKQANCATEEELGELVRQSERELKRAQNGEHRVRTHRLRREQLLQQGKKTAELLATRQMAQQDLEALRAELPQRTEEEAILKRAAAAARVAPALESLSKAREKSAEATRQREDAALQAKAADEALGKSRETAAQIPQWETQVEVARGKKTDSERWVGLFRTAAMAAEKAQEAQAAHEQAAAVAVEQQAQLDTLKSQQAKAQEDLTLRRQQADQVPLLTQQLAELTRHRKAAQRADTVARDLATAATAVDQATAARDKSRTARQDAEEVLSRRTEEQSGRLPGR
jgi:exonuclease SbcC